MDLMTKLTLNRNLGLIRSVKDAVIRYDKICRTCLSSNNVASIFDIVYESYKFVDLLEQHVSILVQEKDALPTQICDNCIADVINLHVFKQKCLQTQVTLDEIIKYNKARKAGIIGEGCNKIQVPLVYQEFLTPQANCQIDEKVPKAGLNKIVMNNNRADNENCKKKQNNSKINSDKTISVNGCTNLQMEIILENDCNPVKCGSITEKNECNQNVCSKKGNNNIAEAEHKIIKNGLNFQKKSGNVSVKKLETVNKVDPSEQKKKNETQKQEKLLARKLVCNVCKQRFDTIDLIKQHRKDTKHYRKRKMACYICGKLVGYHLSSHLRTHTLEKPYKCNTCHKAFSLNCNLQRHIKSHDREKRFICEICGKGYTRQDTLKEHKVIHSGEFPFLCNYCGESFNHVMKHRSHVQRHKEKNDDIPERDASTISKKDPGQLEEYPCEVCHKIFFSKACLCTHQIIHREKRFQCTVCEKKFHIRLALNNHYRVHTGERPYACKECGKSFATAGYLKLHTFIHTGEKPYSCKICSKSFNQRINLTNHLRTHSGKKPYVCDFCGKSFAMKYSLSVHIRTHTGETPHVCEICDRGFRDPNSLKKHKKIHDHENC